MGVRTAGLCPLTPIQFWPCALPSRKRALELGSSVCSLGQVRAAFEVVTLCGRLVRSISAAVVVDWAYLVYDSVVRMC